MSLLNGVDFHGNYGISKETLENNEKASKEFAENAGQTLNSVFDADNSIAAKTGTIAGYLALGAAAPLAVLENNEKAAGNVSDADNSIGAKAGTIAKYLAFGIAAPLANFLFENKEAE